MLHHVPSWDPADSEGTSSLCIHLEAKAEKVSVKVLYFDGVPLGAALVSRSLPLRAAPIVFQLSSTSAMPKNTIYGGSGQWSRGKYKKEDDDEEEAEQEERLEATQAKPGQSSTASDVPGQAQLLAGTLTRRGH